MMNKHFFTYTLVALLMSLLASQKIQAQQTETLTLEEAVETALQNNKQLRIKQLQVLAQEAKVKEAKVKFYPAVTVNAGYQYNVETGGLTIPAGTLGALPLGGNTVILPAEDLIFELGEHNTYNAGAMLYQPLTQLGKINTGVKIAKIDLAILKAEQSKAGLKITNAVEQYYYGILAIRKRMEEAQKNIEVAKLKLHDLESALLAGKATAVDKLGLKANVASEKQELLKLKFKEEDQIAAFKNLTGITTHQLVLVGEMAMVPISKSLEEYMAMAEKGNAKIQIVSLQQQKSEMAIKAEKRDYLPDLGVFVGYNYQKGNVIFPESNPYAGVSLKWNVQEIFSNKQELAQRHYVQQQVEAQEAYIKEQTTISIEQAYRKLKQAEELIAVAQQAVDYREAALDLKRDQQETGLGTPIDVVKAEAALAKAEADLYGAMVTYKIALSELRMLTGEER